MAGDVSDLATVLVGADPGMAASRLLAHLVVRYQAVGGIVLADRAGELEAIASRGARLGCMERAAQQWTKHRASLAQGEAVRGPEWVLAPLVDDGALVGALYLDRPEAYNNNAEACTLALARAAAMPDPGPDLGSYLAAMPAEELEREHLVRALEASEWNIAEVARRLKLARRTIYLRLERYNITRKRVPKTLKGTR